MKTDQPSGGLTPDPKNFEFSEEGRNNRLFILRNKGGMTAAITNFGARLVSLLAPDKNGRPLNLVLGFNHISCYKHRPQSYFGATIGRYANRISQGALAIQGEKHFLDQNENGNCLHGGNSGFDLRIFDIEHFSGDSITMRLLSKDGECGFPGNLRLRVTYKLTGNNGLEITYHASADRTTVVNLTHHSYFNLNGSGNILDHLLEINSDFFIPVDEFYIPLGTKEPVEGTPFDFRKEMTIGSRINADSLQLGYGRGYNHSFLNRPGRGDKPVLRVKGERSGIVMEVYTSEPSVHFYSGNHLGLPEGNIENPYGQHAGFAIETQHLADSPNRENFPSTMLKPGHVFKSRTLYQFA